MSNMNAWKTKDGKVVEIRDMTDSHLSNAIKFLERSQADFPLSDFSDREVSSGFAGAIMNDEQEAREERIEIMKAELSRRHEVNV